ncbi:MAG: YdeI/OmpD-associated family protein [Saprospiraceae bacterium]|nr:YdeI/OmpD-associated family protein [Saprospiraceae bacterium]
MTDLPVYHVNGKVETFEPNNLGYHHFIKIDHEIAEALFFNNTRRILLTDGIIAPLHMSIAKNKDFYYILISKDLLKQFKKKPGELLSLQIQSDRSEYGYPLPEEFAAIFEYDDEARVWFEKLTPGNQRNLIRAIMIVKSDQLRAEKSLIMMEHLKRQKGKVDYKLLREDMKSGR